MTKSDVAAPTVRAIVAGHADFAAGILSAVALITGRDDAFAVFSNRGLSAQGIGDALTDLLSRTGVTTIFTDLPAGSVTMAARRLQRERPELVVVTGTNVAMLLDFLFHAESTDDESLRHAVEKGRAAITVVGGGA